jgi:hypothetical protein
MIFVDWFEFEGVFEESPRVDAGALELLEAGSCGFGLSGVGL